MRFYLGCPEPAWLQRPEMAGVPLFVSHTRLRRLKVLKPSVAPVAIDSGGFTEIDRHGRWDTTVEQYLESMTRYVNELGTVEWMSPMDWMCEPWMIQKTGKSVAEHQELTTANYLELRQRAPQLPIIPVLQGWAPDDYWAHVALYASAGVDLRTLPRVGVGSVCRRQHTGEAIAIFEGLSQHGLSVHGFGVKVKGFQAYQGLLASSDSMAWSFRARARSRANADGTPGPGALPGCTHRNCNYCPKFALLWRDAVLAGRNTP